MLFSIVPVKLFESLSPLIKHHEPCPLRQWRAQLSHGLLSGLNFWH